MDIWLNLVIVYMAFAVFSWVKNGYYFMIVILAALSFGLYSICENKALALFAAVLITNFIGGIYIMYDLWRIGQRTPGGLAAVDPNQIKYFKGA
jgi:hypothetical protein